MQKTIGYAALQQNAPLTPFSFERRDLRATDVQIDILYCGVCHSDIHQTRNEWGGATFPIVPGHEIVGKVSKIGEAVTQFKVGDHVGVGCLVDSCRTSPEPFTLPTPTVMASVSPVAFWASVSLLA